MPPANCQAGRRERPEIREPWNKLTPLALGGRSPQTQIAPETSRVDRYNRNAPSGAHGEAEAGFERFLSCTLGKPFAARHPRCINDGQRPREAAACCAQRPK